MHSDISPKAYLHEGDEGPPVESDDGLNDTRSRKDDKMGDPEGDSPQQNAAAGSADPHSSLRLPQLAVHASSGSSNFKDTSSRGRGAKEVRINDQGERGGGTKGMAALWKKSSWLGDDFTPAGGLTDLHLPSAQNLQRVRRASAQSRGSVGSNRGFWSLARGLTRGPKSDPSVLGSAPWGGAGGEGEEDERDVEALQELLADAIDEENERKAEEERKGQHWIDSAQGQAIVSVVIILNAVTLGYIVESVFTLIFSVELALRIRSEGLKRFFTILVGSAIVDSWILTPVFLSRALSGSAGSSTQVLGLVTVLRVARILRLARIAKLVRNSRDLTVLIQGTLQAMSALAWVSLMLILLNYVCAIFVTRVIGHSEEQYEDEDDAARIKDFFGTVPRSMLTLFQIMTLEGWPDIARMVIREQPWMWVFFVVYIMITTVTLLNLVTGVIVEKVMGVASAEEKDLVAKISEERVSVLKELVRVFMRINKQEEGWGEITLEDFLESLDESTLRSLKNLDIAVNEPKTLFGVLDVSQNGKVSLLEFVEGMIRLRGSGQSIHLLAVQSDLHRATRALARRLDHAEERTQFRMQHLEETVFRLLQPLDRERLCLSGLGSRQASGLAGRASHRASECDVASMNLCADDSAANRLHVGALERGGGLPSGVSVSESGPLERGDSREKEREKGTLSRAEKEREELGFSLGSPPRGGAAEREDRAPGDFSGHSSDGGGNVEEPQIFTEAPKVSASSSMQEPGPASSYEVRHRKEPPPVAAPAFVGAGSLRGGAVTGERETRGGASDQTGNPGPGGVE
uniref:EF-hand domain-containing protein n=1 Tax=Chromera velia CCMP2878 TaxID=1169474 RepID=A0A0G4G4F5_9ALVE|eukprot:Cvel_4134.t1-p1 / transcript=Cvel_4134.t1 / gene=Cvel_4134 / organism=Chromera_velia_CCMP2878 / gene_product=hypothetical protein / transcript_product=hypothetical protein / location=Cvel_scaffold177:27624-38849(+) / protein_length=801 / sequence_SO=supercontig / SO=protein_coding / is_pseudo=false